MKKLQIIGTVIFFLLIELILEQLLKHEVPTKIIFIIGIIVIVYYFFFHPSENRINLSDLFYLENTHDLLYHVKVGVSGAICGYVITFIIGL